MSLFNMLSVSDSTLAKALAVSRNSFNNRGATRRYRHKLNARGFLNPAHRACYVCHRQVDKRRYRIKTSYQYPYPLELKVCRDCYKQDFAFPSIDRLIDSFRLEEEAFCVSPDMYAIPKNVLILPTYVYTEDFANAFHAFYLETNLGAKRIVEGRFESLTSEWKYYEGGGYVYEA